MMENKRMVDKTKSNKQRNGKLSLYPLKFEEAVKGLLKVRPGTKAKDIKIAMVKESEK